MSIRSETVFQNMRYEFRINMVFTLVLMNERYCKNSMALRLCNIICFTYRSYLIYLHVNAFIPEIF